MSVGVTVARPKSLPPASTAGALAARDTSTLAGLDSGSLAGLDSGSLAGLDSGSLAGLDSGEHAGFDADLLESHDAPHECDSAAVPSLVMPASAAAVMSPGATALLGSVALPATWPARSLADRLRDYVALCKPKIAVMVLVTVAVGFLIGSAGAPWSTLLLIEAGLGITLAAFGSSALNQWMERESDALMVRTMIRPLPAGRLSSNEALIFGLALAAIGVSWLTWRVNPLTGALTAMTVGLYAGVYTPLKRHTSVCTAIGAIPGALPPLLGYTAASGELALPGWTLFAILFLWQFPHFLAIAWIYREAYAGAGLRMLPNVHPQPGVTGGLATLYAVILIPVSLLPTALGLAGSVYAGAALLLGLAYLGTSIRFLLDERRETARHLLWMSLVYLPLVLGVLTFDHLRVLSQLPWQ